jgi:hypothetical protein
MMEDLIRYMQPNGPLPDLVDSKTGSILIIGSAQIVTDDLDIYDHLHTGERMAVNDAIPWYSGKLDHAASLHPDKLWSWLKVRKDNPVLHSTRRAGGFPENYIWPMHADGGTSGLFAVAISLLMGFESIVLAGIPVSDDPKITGETGKIKAGAMQEEWLRFSRFFDGRVKSLSGWTHEQFGAPDV